jgi:hypothetical protein
MTQFSVEGRNATREGVRKAEPALVVGGSKDKLIGTAYNGLRSPLSIRRLSPPSPTHPVSANSLARTRINLPLRRLTPCRVPTPFAGGSFHAHCLFYSRAPYHFFTDSILDHQRPDF